MVLPEERVRQLAEAIEGFPILWDARREYNLILLSYHVLLL